MNEKRNFLPFEIEERSCQANKGLAGSFAIFCGKIKLDRVDPAFKALLTVILPSKNQYRCGPVKEHPSDWVKSWLRMNSRVKNTNAPKTLGTKPEMNYARFKNHLRVASHSFARSSRRSRDCVLKFLRVARGPRANSKIPSQTTQL